MTMKAILIALLLTTFTVVNGRVVLTSCARMDTPILSKAAQGLCITSCKYQNCGTGFCQKVRGRPTCMCRRCANGGGSWPVIPLSKLVEIALKRGKR